MADSGPITKGGVHPISSEKTHSFGVRGAPAKATKQHLEAKKASGAPNTKPKETSAKLAAKQEGEVKTKGSTAAELFYPKGSGGLRGKVVNGGVA